MLDIMFRHGGSTAAPNNPPSPDNTSPSDSESEMHAELEQKRREIDEEISKFRAQKDKEFRDFEEELRSRRRRKNGGSPKPRNGHQTGVIKTRPARTSSSSALDLLIGHGMSGNCQSSHALPKKHGWKSTARKDTSTANTTMLPSKPTLSLDPQNITGDIPHSNPLTPPTPTLLTRSITLTSSTPPPSASPPQQKLSSPKLSPLPTPTQERQDGFTGLFVPTYLPLLSATSETQFPKPSPLVTPPLESSTTILIQQPIGSVQLPSGIVPLQSSSYPPSLTVLSPTNPANKRSYTAPTVSSAPRIPSALRTASGGNLGRKRKRVTFRLADSAIVEPSSSYEEGPSPSMGGSASTSTSSLGSSKSGHKSGHGPRRSLLGSSKTSDQEDEEAGVKPGMNMGEVMQKLNEHSITADEDEPNVDFDDEDMGHIDLGYHEDEDEDSDDEPMAMSVGSQQDYSEPTTRSDEGDEIDDEDGSYFSPRAKHALSPLAQHKKELQAPDVERERHGSSPISPYRDTNWDNLSSSDKDRLLFSRRVSDEDDSEMTGKDAQSRSEANSNSRAQTSRQASKKPAGSNPASDGVSDSYNFAHAIDGGSGVGFFELDEELASPDAGVARPFEFPVTGDDLEPVMSYNSDAAPNSEIDPDSSGAKMGNTEDKSNPTRSDLRDFTFSRARQFGEAPGGLKRTSSEKHLSTMDNSWKTGFAGTASVMPVGSVPINIIKPSPSVDSSWVGTFGH